MRLPKAEHTAHPWVIAQIAPDFELIDAWALPAQGGRDDFDALLKIMASLDGANAESGVTRALFRVRYQLGAWFGWDDAARQLPIPGCTETTLSQPLPVNLRASATGLDLSPASFIPLYRTRNEWAAELSNGTVHAVLHLAWVRERQRPAPRADGRLRQAQGQAWRDVHGADQALPAPDRLPHSPRCRR